MEHFLKAYPSYKRFEYMDSEMLHAFMLYDWPGNVRELQNVLYQYLSLGTARLGDTVIGESATNALAGTTEDIQELKGKAGEAAEAVGGAAASISSSLNGVSNFIGQATGGGLGNMIGGFFSNLGRGNVSGLSIAGLIAAAFLVFGRTGWLGKIAGLFLGMMLIGNNAGLVRTEVPESAQRNSAQGLSTEEGQAQGGGMRR